MHICCRAESTSRHAAHIVLSRSVFKGFRFLRRPAHAQLPLHNILLATYLCSSYLNGWGTAVGAPSYISETVYCL